MSNISWFIPRACRVLIGAAVAVTAVVGSAHGADSKGKSMSYGEAREFLAKHTKLIELTNESGARVAIAPEWQGRVMTSTCAGLDGPSFGFICNDFITAGKLNPHFNNYGGEERLWLAPEGGQFSLWFKPGAAQNLTNWYTPPALNEGAWPVSSPAGAPSVRMSAAMKLQNASATEFQLAVTRDVRLLGPAELNDLLGASAAAMLQAPGVKMVAYQTVNQVTNRGSALTQAKGLVSIWLLSMLNAGPRTVTIVPYKPGGEAELGPVVRSDYFGQVPPERLKVTPQAVLFNADANCRSKIGTSQRRARNVLGSIDFENGVLTLAKFSMPSDPTKHPYLNSVWQVPQAEPFRGDVVNSYNDGPNDTGSQLGKFYELESVSPAKELKTGESLEHRSSLLHIQGDMKTLGKIAREVLGVELDAVRKEMPGK